MSLQISLIRNGRNIINKEELLAVEKALRILYTNVKATTDMGGKVKEIFHNHMNKYTELLKQFK